MHKLSILILIVFFAACGPKENNASRYFETKDIRYEQDGKPFEGFIAYPKQADKKLPAVLIIHEWDGLGDYVKMRAKMLAENGYFAFAMDMYGKGIRAKDHKEAAELSGVYGKDRVLMRTRIAAALALLKSRGEIDATKIAIIGYCFGGMAAIEEALSGADLKAIATFHASLSFPTIATAAKNIKTPILIHHGGADQFVSDAAIKTLRSEFDKAHVNYQFIVHPGATHGFTNRNNKGHESMGMAYDAKADLASWASLLTFLRANMK